MIATVFLLSSYSDIFGIEPSYVDQNKQYTRPDASSFYIHENSYLNIQGGAISFAPYTASDVLLESCIFGNCSSKTNGGCVFFSNVKIAIFLKICCYHCYTSGSGHFGYIYSTIRDEFKLFSAFSSAPSNFGNGLLYFESSNHIMNNNNISRCHSSLIRGSNIITFHLQMNSIVDCSSTNYHFYGYMAPNQASNFNNSNYINNSVTSSSLFYFQNYNGVFSFTIFQSVFQNNKGILFASDGIPTVTINNCWIVHNTVQYSITQGNKITLNSGISYTSTHVISLHSTYECQTIENPLGFEVTPHRTFPNPPTECFVVESNIGGTHLLMTVLAIKLTILELLFT